MPIKLNQMDVAYVRKKGSGAKTSKYLQVISQTWTY